MRKKTLLGLGALVVAGAAGLVTCIGPRNVIGMIRYDQRDEGKLQVGDRAPDVEMVTLAGERVRLAGRLGPKPTVLIFGSFT
jgi:hypothetical protein